jgi:GR25 family glycosyltransferase involved in LPS biosynthesis
MQYYREELNTFQNVENNTAYVINLSHRTDRWITLNQNCGHIFDLRRIEGVRDMDGWKGCFKSHKKILKYAEMANLDTVLVLEDDCRIVEHHQREKHYNFNEQWSQIKEWLDSNLDKWDIYVGGTTIYGFHVDGGPLEMENFDLGILRMKKAYCRHFAYYNKSIFSDIINHPIERPIDDLINNHRILISYPFLAIQSTSYSNICDNIVNYFDKFEYSENVIKNYIDTF